MPAILTQQAFLKATAASFFFFASLNCFVLLPLHVQRLGARGLDVLLDLLERLQRVVGRVLVQSEVRQRVGDTLPRRLGYVRGASLEPIETYASPIPDEALLKYDDAARTGLFSKFWVATPTYYQERQVDPWIVAEVDGSDRWAVIARWDV